MLKVGIVGYGNLGKSLAQAITNQDDIELCAIFSRREIADKTLQKKIFVPFAQIEQYVGQIDLLFLALGSYDDITKHAPKICGKFHTVDSFDNHTNIEKYKNSLAVAAGNKISVVSVGWDPGVLSMIRTLASIYPNNTTTTFWGKGVSQGHTNAIKSIDGVIDAIQFTVPLENAVKEAKTGEICTSPHQTHRRVCYVACPKQLQSIVVQKIVTMPDYFAPFETEINFVSEEEIAQLKTDMSHKGCVISQSDAGKLFFELNTHSNPILTAFTMIAYAKAIEKMAGDHLCGVFDCLDIPLRYLVDNKKML